MHICAPNPAYLHVPAVRHDIWLAAPVPRGQLPRGHAPAAEGRDPVGVVDAPDADDVILVGGVVERPVQGAVVADGAHHDYAVRSYL